jgi:hypothetical protein
MAIAINYIPVYHTGRMAEQGLVYKIIPSGFKNKHALQGTLQKDAFVALEDILVPDALCQEVLPQLAGSGDYDANDDKSVHESSEDEGRSRQGGDSDKSAIARSI